MFFLSGYPNLFTQETRETVAQWALSQPRNTYHFLETQVYPPKGVHIMVDDNDTTHQWEVEISKFTECTDVVDIGYKWYNEQMDKASTAGPRLSKKLWEQTHKNIYEKVSETIKQHHGIQCFLNGPNGLDDDKNNVVLHFCDALVIALRKVKGLEPPKVLIESRHFKTINESITYLFFPSDSDLPEILTSQEASFLFFNADIFYHMYGLWQNNSNKPIRVENKDLPELERSAEFSNNGPFIGHQKGKYNKLKRCTHHEIAKYLYICHE